MRSARGLALLCGFLKNDSRLRSERNLPTRQAHKRVDTKVSTLLRITPFLRGHGEIFRTETIKERQRIFPLLRTDLLRVRPFLLTIRSVGYRTATHAVSSAQARHKVNCPQGKRRSPGGYPCRANPWHVIPHGTYEFRRSVPFILAGPVCNNALTNRAALSCRT